MTGGLMFSDLLATVLDAFMVCLKYSQGMKVSCTHFQCAAWAFQHLRDEFPQPRGSDTAHELLSFYIQVMLVSYLFIVFHIYSWGCHTFSSYCATLPSFLYELLLFILITVGSSPGMHSGKVYSG